jgi:ATP/maltotriose-dependent transcriptional regulator MalT
VIEEKCGASDAVISSTLQSLVSACMLTKDNARTEDVCRRLIQVSGKSTSTTARMQKSMATSMLASIYMQTGRMDEGMRMMKEASGSMQQQQGSTDGYAKAIQQEMLEIEKQIDNSEEAALGKL